MKSYLIATILIVFTSTICLARAVRSPDMKTLMKRSEIIFVGKIKTIKPSGITTKLTYPTWKGVIFEWLKVEVEVIEPIKGTEKKQIVKVLMLSTRGPGPMAMAPGMVDPKVDQHYLLCLLPTKIKEVYASITAPFDDNQAIFLLDRKSWNSTYYKDGKKVEFREQSDKNSALWNLIDDKGKITLNGVKKLRKKYNIEIATPASKDAIIHIRWKKKESEGSWQWNVPDDEDYNDDQAKDEN